MSTSIHLYSIPQTLEQITLEKAKRSLSDDELLAADKIIASTRLHEFVLGRHLLREHLACHSNCRPLDIRLQKHSYGKLYIEDNPIYFNLAHSGNYLVIALNKTNEIGIDIEQPKERIPDLVNIATRYFTKEEGAKIQAAAPARQVEIFYEIWTKKEAVLKAIGTGISGGLDTFNALECKEDQRINLAINQQEYALYLNYWKLNGTNSENLFLSLASTSSQQAVLQQYFNTAHG